MKLTRRALLVSGGILGGGFVIGAAGIGVYINQFDRRGLQQSALSAGSAKVVAQWIAIAPDGAVTILSPHTEMGQGAQTGLLQIVLDELDADPEQTTITMAPASPEFSHSDAMGGFILGEKELTGWTRRFVDKTFGRMCQLSNIQFTGGSTAIRFTGWRGLRRAAAAARQMLAEAGAAQLGVHASAVRTENGQVIHDASGRSVGYGALAEAVSTMPVPPEPAYKAREDWKFIGTRYPRVDLPDKIFATATYGIDVAVEGMRFAAVAPRTLAMGTITAVTNEAEVRAMRGVEAVLVLDDAVAVVADNPWRAEKAARAVQMECQPPEGGLLRSDELLAEQRAIVSGTELSSLHAVGDTAAAFEGATVIEAEYFAPYLAHSPMEPLNATIWDEDGKIHVATGVQGPLAARAMVAEVLERPMEEVILYPHTMGGGFGRRNGLAAAGLNWLVQAARIHKAVGGAVKLTWSREADVRLSTFRPSDVAMMRAALGPDGKPVAWHARMYAPVLAPAEATPHYSIPNVTIESAQGEPALEYSYWRSVDASVHGFFIESFIDELARAASVDPVDYRLSLLEADGRHARVLSHVAEMSGWRSHDASGGRALGVALVASFGSIVAQVAEVSRDGGRPKVHRVWCAIDCGTAINPGSVEAQMQGGILYGLTAALHGRITLEDGAIKESNFHDYQIVRFSDAPRIAVDILSSPGAPVGGAGEPGTPPIAPAVANALAALDARPREMPFVS